MAKKKGSRRKAAKKKTATTAPRKKATRKAATRKKTARAAGLRTSAKMAIRGFAKSLDPNDPTAFLYSGILKQSENRPIEAFSGSRGGRPENGGRSVRPDFEYLQKALASKPKS